MYSWLQYGHSQLTITQFPLKAKVGDWSILDNILHIEARELLLWPLMLEKMFRINVMYHLTRKHQACFFDPIRSYRFGVLASIHLERGICQELQGSGVSLAQLQVDLLPVH